LSSAQCPWKIFDSILNILSGVVSVRKPRVPRCTPRIATFFLGILRAVLRRVPSPPITIAMSDFVRTVSFLWPSFLRTRAEFSS